MPPQVYETLTGLFISELCPRCRGRTRRGFCAACTRDFEPNSMSCRICAQPVQAGAVVDCARHATSWKTNAVRAPYLYARPLDRYIYSLKFRNERRIGRALGLLLAEAMQPHRRDIDAIVPVPLHASRLHERGYNQALEIARSLSFELRLPILRAGIYRSVATPPQTRLRAESRRENLRFAFVVRRDLAGYRLAIVDDVVTTGATVNGLAGKLREAGAVYLEAWAVARTPRSNESAGPPAGRH